MLWVTCLVRMWLAYSWKAMSRTANSRARRAPRQWLRKVCSGGRASGGRLERWQRIPDVASVPAHRFTQFGIRLHRLNLHLPLYPHVGCIPESRSHSSARLDAAVVLVHSPVTVVIAALRPFVVEGLGHGLEQGWEPLVYRDIVRHAMVSMVTMQLFSTSVLGRSEMAVILVGLPSICPWFSTRRAVCAQALTRRKRVSPQAGSHVLSPQSAIAAAGWVGSYWPSRYRTTIPYITINPIEAPWSILSLI